MIEFTPQEEKIVQLRAEGVPDKKIASTLGITGRTLGRHVANINLKIKPEGFVWAKKLVCITDLCEKG